MLRMVTDMRRDWCMWCGMAVGDMLMVENRRNLRWNGLQCTSYSPVLRKLDGMARKGKLTDEAISVAEVHDTDSGNNELDW
jgi:hypothetical protein